MPNETTVCSHCGRPAFLVSADRTTKKYFCRSCKRLSFIRIELDAPGRPRYFKCYNHQGKANRLVSALSEKFTFDPGLSVSRFVRFMLADSDVGGRLNQLKSVQRCGVNRFFVYPHSARPSMINDYYPAWEHTTAQFVVNEYHAEVLRTYGYNKPIHSTGWYLSDVLGFTPREAVRNVLFAPIHPKNAPADREANKRALCALYTLVKSGDINLTVRYIGTLVDNGIERLEGVQYIRGEMNLSIEMIHAADVVIGHQTFAWLAVALGVPTVMFAEDMPAHVRKHNTTYTDVKSWGLVSHLFRYPLDLFDSSPSDTLSLLQRAVKSDYEVDGWKRRMIGDPFDGKKFTEIVESYL